MRSHQVMSVILAAGIAAAAFEGGLFAQDAPTLPLRLRATVMVLNEMPPGAGKMDIGAGGVTELAGRPTGSAFLSLTIDRWSTDDERSRLAQVMSSGGTAALTLAIEELTVGHIQVNDDLRLPIRVASTWKTAHAQVVRFATSGFIVPATSARPSRSTDYPISIIEISLPPEGPGEGSLVAATRTGFDDRGGIEALSLPLNTGIQRLTNVEIEAPRKGAKQP